MIEMTEEQKERLDDIRDGLYEEHQLVHFIRDLLLTEEQRKDLFDSELEIADMLNGRFTRSEDHLVFRIYKDWNEKLGENFFGY